MSRLHACAVRRAALTKLLVLLACVGLAQSGTAQAQARQFPPAARPALLQVTQPPEVLLNGQAERLAPGARIKGVNNLLVLSASLIGQRRAVKYLRDAQGLVHEIWLLSETEAQGITLERVVNFNFASDRVTVKTDDGKTPFRELPKFLAQ